MTEQTVRRYDVARGSLYPSGALAGTRSYIKVVSAAGHDAAISALQSRLDAAERKCRDELGKRLVAEVKHEQQLAERDALLREAFDAWTEHEGHDALFAAMDKVAALLSASAEPTNPVSAQETEEAARYRWLRDRNDWHTEPRIDAADGTVWKLTFYTPAPIIDPTDDENLDVALIAAMLEDASGGKKDCAAFASAESARCDTCKGQGEVYSGQDQHFHYFDFQPPEPIMEACPECGGEDVKGGDGKQWEVTVKLIELPEAHPHE